MYWINVHYSESASHSVMSDSLPPHGLYNPWNSQGWNTGVGSHFLPQGIFPAQRVNSGIPYCRQILYQLNHQGSPRILAWVAHPFSSGSSWPRNQPGCPALQADFLPIELSGKPHWTNWDLLCSTQNSVQCCVAAWMGGGFGGEWMHVYGWRSLFVVHLKLSQHCLSAIPQQKTKS